MYDLAYLKIKQAKQTSGEELGKRRLFPRTQQERYFLTVIYSKGKNSTSSSQFCRQCLHNSRTLVDHIMSFCSGSKKQTRETFTQSKRVLTIGRGGNLGDSSIQVSITDLLSVETNSELIFMFVARQQRITIEESHYFIDLVFYNRFLNCFVLIDLKKGKLAHQDLGQMQMYVNMYDRTIRMKDKENPTIGLLLCEKDDKLVVEYTLPEGNKQVFSSEYMLYLPSVEELEQELHRKISSVSKK